MTSNFYPVTQLLHSPSDVTVAISGPHIQILDSKTGNLLSSTISLDQKLHQIYAAALDKSSRFLATIADDKKLSVWEIGSQLRLASRRDLPKKATSVQFTSDGQTILVSDKFGDVFSYPIDPPPQPVLTEEQTESEPTEPSKGKRKGKKKENPPVPKDSIISHPSTSNGTLILGHTSLLTTFILSHDEKYIITADRDEHIRVSWYPQGYTIESFCLGSTQFVSALHIPSSCPDILVSGGGDAEIRLWDWHSGVLKHEVPVLDVVKEYIYVKVDPHARRNWGDDDEPGESVVKQKQKGKQRNEDDPMHDLDETSGNDDGTPSAQNEQQADEERDLTILVIQKIQSVHLGHDTLIIFSALGATALFTFCLSQLEASPSITSHDFGKPILDFIPVVDADNGISVWVSLDQTRTEDGSYPDEVDQSNIEYVQAVTIASDGKLVSPSECPLSPASKILLDSLNANCLIPATSSTLSSLDLYANLLAYPKKQESDETGETSTARSHLGIKSNESRKYQARLKKKNAVLEKQRDLQQNGENTPGTQTPSGDQVDEPEPKRTRSDE